MKKIVIYIHPSDLTETKTRRLQIWVTSAFYEVVDDLRKKEGFPSMSSFLYKIIGDYVFRKQGSEKIEKDTNE